MNSQVTNWLLGGPAWIKYRTQLDLLGLNSKMEGLGICPEKRTVPLADIFGLAAGKKVEIFP